MYIFTNMDTCVYMHIYSVNNIYIYRCVRIYIYIYIHFIYIYKLSRTSFTCNTSADSAMKSRAEF